MVALSDLQVLLSAWGTAGAAEVAAHRAFVDAVHDSAASTFLGQDPGNALMVQVLACGSYHFDDLMHVGTTGGEVYHWLSAFDAGDRTMCGKATDKMVVVLAKGRRLCRVCPDRV